MTNIELPEDLKKCQERIDNYRKEQELINQIGKYYCVLRSVNNSNDELRRVYLDKESNIRVDEFKISGTEYDGGTLTFEFRSYLLKQAIRGWDGANHYSEIKGQVFYNRLQRLLQIDQIKSFFEKGECK